RTEPVANPPHNRDEAETRVDPKDPGRDDVVSPDEQYADETADHQHPAERRPVPLAAPRQRDQRHEPEKRIDDGHPVEIEPAVAPIRLARGTWRSAIARPSAAPTRAWARLSILHDAATSGSSGSPAFGWGSERLGL